jgi:ABC-2 type transport system ATP-binding protein
MIELRNVCKCYNKGALRAVDDLTLSIPPGEIFGFLGPNGAGKTTTIKMIVGILAPDSGSIVIEGRDNHREPLACKAVTAYVPDAPEIYERLTGIEYLNFIADVYGVPAAARTERTMRWLEVFELAGAAGDPIQTYSHGMRQKIVLTGALIVEPRVFVLDEPLTGLDPRSAHNLKEAMRSHCDRGGTLFFRPTSWRSLRSSATASPSSTRAAWSPAAAWTIFAARPVNRSPWKRSSWS